MSYVTSLSIPGLNHLKAGGTVCQDAACSHVGPYGEVVLAVADGHGGASYRFSHIGSRMAVEVARERTLAWVVEYEALQHQRPTLHLREAEEHWSRLVRSVYACWVERIVTYDRAIRGEDALPDSEILRLYGTTLLVVLVYRDVLFALQVGDGAIITASTHSGSQWLFESNKAIDNATLSMCSSPEQLFGGLGVSKGIQSRVVSLNEAPVGFVGLYSDGMTDPFEGRDYDDSRRGQPKTSSVQLGTRYLDHCRSAVTPAEGWRELCAQLLKDACQQTMYCGDDTSIALAWMPSRDACSPPNDVTPPTPTDPGETSPTVEPEVDDVLEVRDEDHEPGDTPEPATWVATHGPEMLGTEGRSRSWMVEQYAKSASETRPTVEQPPAEIEREDIREGASSVADPREDKG